MACCKKSKTRPVTPAATAEVVPIERAANPAASSFKTETQKHNRVPQKRHENQTNGLLTKEVTGFDTQNMQLQPSLKEVDRDPTETPDQLDATSKSTSFEKKLSEIKTDTSGLVPKISPQKSWHELVDELDAKRQASYEKTESKIEELVRRFESKQHSKEL